jgi:hypothetical protein
MRTAFAAAAAAALAGCTAAPPSPLPPAAVAPPAPPEAVPHRPLPPPGAPFAMATPPVGPDGLRRTINSGLDSDETIWHLRAAWNVAALGCRSETDKPILDGYAAFLKRYAKPLAAVNARLDAKFRRAAGSAAAGRTAREAHTTQLYNYFAAPAVAGDLCRVAREVADGWRRSPPKNLAAFAATTLPKFEAVYLAFFDAYDRYRAEAAAWDAKYGAKYGAGEPGYGAAHGAATPPS